MSHRKDCWFNGCGGRQCVVSSPVIAEMRARYCLIHGGWMITRAEAAVVPEVDSYDGLVDVATNLFYNAFRFKDQDPSIKASLERAYKELSRYRRLDQGYEPTDSASVGGGESNPANNGGDRPPGEADRGGTAGPSETEEGRAPLPADEAPTTSEVPGTTNLVVEDTASASGCTCRGGIHDDSCPRHGSTDAASSEVLDHPAIVRDQYGNERSPDDASGDYGLTEALANGDSLMIWFGRVGWKRQGRNPDLRLALLYLREAVRREARPRPDQFSMNVDAALRHADAVLGVPSGSEDRS
jgi:hypothetical protein